MTSYPTSYAHLRDELHWLDLCLQWVMERQSPSGHGWFGVSVNAEEAKTLMHKSIDAYNVTANNDALWEQIVRFKQGIQEKVQADMDQGRMFPLYRLARIFQLSPFDLDVLVICLAVELDNKYEALFGFLQDDITQRHPSVELMLRLLCISEDERLQARNSFSPSSPLLVYQLLRRVNSSATDSLLTQKFALDKGIVNYLLESPDMDPEVTEYVTEVPVAQRDDTTVMGESVGSLSWYLQEPRDKQWIAQFEGPNGDGKRQHALSLCAASDLALYIVDTARLLHHDNDTLTQILIHIFRAAILGNAAVYFDSEGVHAGEEEALQKWFTVMQKILYQLGWITFIASKQPLVMDDALKSHYVFRQHFALPDYVQRKALWSSALEENGVRLDEVDLDLLASQYRFSKSQIHHAIQTASAISNPAGNAPNTIAVKDLMAVCRELSRPMALSYAQHITSHYQWNDLVLPAATKTQLQEIIHYVRYNAHIQYDWGFAQRHGTGHGTNILFSGKSGTGKTMAAGIMANLLGLELYRIDLSMVVSKYIGETEKNINRIFREVENYNVLLFFDEADALFGKRTELKDSHDRYANIEVSYLLQKMESHDGVVVLATNLSQNLDDAFLRRLHFVIHFPMPEKQERLLVWQQVFPHQTPLHEDVDLEFLARRFSISGGNIINIARNASVMASAEATDVTMRHLILATKREYEKIGNICQASDFGEYYELVS